MRQSGTGCRGVVLLALICALRTAGAVDPAASKGTEPTEARVVTAPPTEPGNIHYIHNRAPLAPDALIKLPIGSIKPGGWLREQLHLMADGMTGHLGEISPWCKPDSSAWLSKTGEGENGWEELPYWLKGLGDLGYVLGDERITAEARRWIDGILDSQAADGYFGPRANKAKHDVWPNMPVLDALRSFQAATGDPGGRVLPFMAAYFKWEAGLADEQLLPGSWQKFRGGDNVESVLWLYNRTGEAWLLDLARRLHERTARWDEGIASWHGVNICQGFREPAAYFVLTGDHRYYDATERNYLDVMNLYGQVPGGMFGADEDCRKGFGDPRQGAETCSMVEFMHSFQTLLKISGDPLQADRCEDVAFNSLPAAFTPDYKGLHYLTAPNMVQLDKENKAPGIENDGTMFSYDPADYRCCQHNHAMGWPYFAEHLWCATQDNGLCAVLYSSGEVKAKVGGGGASESGGPAGRVITIAERTDYPFDGSVVMMVATGGDPVRFPLYLRVPRWCSGAKILVNGQAVDMEASPPSYVRLERTWEDGDTVTLRLPMRVAVTRWKANHDAVSVSCGPLTYALPIGERWARYGGTDAWPAHEVFPTTPWNYGLVLDPVEPAYSFEVIRRSGPLPRQPFVPDADLPQLIVSAKRIPGWQQDATGLVGTLQASPAQTDEPTEKVTLIPMGAARLRISAFPVIGDGPDAAEWKAPPPPRHPASISHDDPNAVSDGVLPSSSADQSIPRFTWWPSLGKTEWIDYPFDQPRAVTGCELYWFDDTGVGRCRVPESWRVLYKDGDAWNEVKNVHGGGVEQDRFNAIGFDQVTTTVLRVEAKLRAGFSGGILEWRIQP
jgi:hypothetical protein